MNCRVRGALFIVTAAEGANYVRYVYLVDGLRTEM